MTRIVEYTNRQLKQAADVRMRKSRDSTVPPSLKRVLETLPEGPFTPGELRTLIEEEMDLDGLADSTRQAYMRHARRFVKDLA